HPHHKHHSPFFFNPPPTPPIYTLSLHDALPISPRRGQTPEAGGHQHQVQGQRQGQGQRRSRSRAQSNPSGDAPRPHRRHQGRRRSEEHTSELQSRGHLVCRLLLEKKKKQTPHKK